MRMRITSVHHGRPIQRVRLQVRLAFCGAARGATMLSAVVLRTVTATRRLDSIGFRLLGELR